MTELAETPKTSRTRISGWIFVIQSGLVSSAIALAGAHYLSTRWELDPFELRWEALVPLGALGLGIVAATGYAIGSWWAGVRVGKRLLAAIVAYQIIALFVGQYIAFRGMHLVWRSTGGPVGFWWWYHRMTLGYTLRHLNGSEDPMGYAGYLVRLIDTAGFAVGALLVGALFMRAPYCEACQRFKKDKHLATLAASLPLREIRTESEADAFEAEQEQEFERATALFEKLGTCAIEGDAPGFKQAVAEANRAHPPVDTLLCRMKLSMSWCPGCLNGTVQALVLRREDGIVRIDPLPKIEPSAAFFEGMTG